MRLIRTCKEMGIKTVAVYSKVDEESLHVRFADEAVCIGPAPSSESYLKMANIMAAAEICNADAIHPGYGFLSENAKFSKICKEHGIKFIGASSEMIEKMGDKASAKATMKAAGVPTIPGSEGILESFDHAKKIAKNIGYMPQKVPELNINNEVNKHFNNNVSHPFFNSNDDLMTKKINYMIELLEQQKNEKTQNITEELILYCFLGIFVIFIVDSFVKVGKNKYKR